MELLYLPSKRSSKMKKVIFAVAALFATTFTQAQWNVDKSHSSIGFSVSHMVVSEATGVFKDFAGTVTSTKEDFSDLKGEFTIQAASINTDDDKRDEHLRNADFFDVTKYPTITFKIGDMKKLNGNKYSLEGDMTMHGVTKKIKWDLTYNGTVKDLYKMTRAGFKATTVINRKDFGLSWGALLEAGGAAVGYDVTITTRIEIAKK
jgi:polyisoprenoid-binding protein YceI